MTHRERIAAIFQGRQPDRAGFWLGEPHCELVPRLLAHFGVKDDESLRRAIDDDCRWRTPDWSCYAHPEGRPIFNPRWGMDRKIAHGEPGCFAHCEDVAEIEKYPWPDATYLDMKKYRSQFAPIGDCWRMGGAWGSFYHGVMDFFGLENYFMKMYENPAVVHAVTRHMVNFYLAANKRVLNECGDCIDVVFFGNDFGTQQDLMISPEKFQEFVLPYFREMIDQAKSYGKPVQLHSCGAIARVIPMLIDAGIDALHPLQAKARGMDARALAQYSKDIVMVGGVDTQDLLWRGTPQQIKDEISRLREIWQDRWIISPSHEKLMPEVPVENVAALCEAATATSALDLHPAS